MSGKRDYSLLICADAGPQYAESLGWQYDKFNNISSYLTKDIWIFIDTRLYDDEYESLYYIISNNPDSKFVLTVTDPYFELSIDQPLYKLLFKSVNLDNVLYLSRYQPTELVKFLETIKGKQSLITLNYPYLIKNQRDFGDYTNRKNKIIFSGSISSSLYPERYLFWRRMTRSLWRFKIDVLPHPGYPDVGMSLRHSIINDNYLDHLSGFKLMFVSPSRCSLEFLKYAECAYAGCVPIGKAPETFDQELKKYFIELHFDDLNRSLRKVFSIPGDECLDIAVGYRREMSKQRSPELLNDKLKSFLKKV